MKKKVKKLINSSLRFHHQDLHEELDDLKKSVKRLEELLEVLITNVSSEMQKLQRPISGASYSTEELWLSESNVGEGRECECGRLDTCGDC